MWNLPRSGSLRKYRDTSIAKLDRGAKWTIEKPVDKSRSFHP